MSNARQDCVCGTRMRQARNEHADTIWACPDCLRTRARGTSTIPPIRIKASHPARIPPTPWGMNIISSEVSA